MAFQIQGEPGALLAGMRLTPPDPAEMEGNALKLQQMRDTAALAPLKRKEAEINLKTAQFDLDEKQRRLDQLKQYQNVMRSVAANEPDPDKIWDKARPQLAPILDPKLMTELDTLHITQRKNVADINEKTQQADKLKREAEEALREEYGNAAEVAVKSDNPYVIMDAQLRNMERDHPDKTTAIEAVREQFKQNPDDALRLAEGLRTQKSRAATQELAGKEAQRKSEEATAALHNAEVPGAQAKSDLEVASAAALKSMTDADWQKAIDGTIEDKNSPLYRRTVQQVQFYRQKGDLKGASDAIKTAGEQLGKTESAVATAKATAPIKIDVAAATAGARADLAGLTEDDYQRAGEQYMRTGVMPAMGRDSVTRGKIVHYGQQWARDNGLGPSDIVTMQAAYQGDKASLANFQKQRDQIVSFEQTAQKNLDLMIEKAKPLIDSGSPLLNRPLRSINRNLLGGTEQAAFDAAVRVANNEVAKVTSGGGLSGVLSDNARRDIENLNPQNATLGQYLAVAKVMRQDMTNRHQSMDATLSDIKSRIGGNPSGGTGNESAGKIRVKRKSDGATGTLDAKDFDPAKYEKM